MGYSAERQREIMRLLSGIDSPKHPAWRDLVNELHDQIILFIHKQLTTFPMAPAERADLANDIFMRAIVYRRRYDPERGTLLNWLSTIAINVLNDRRPETFHEELTPNISANDRVENAAERRILLQKIGVFLNGMALSGGTEAKKVMAYKLYMMGYGQRKIAAMLQEPQTNVNNWINRLRRAVRSEFGGEYHS